jgi:hypothetical protein
MLKLSLIGGFNPFDFVVCPTCGSNEFETVSFSGIYCSRCETGFRVRPTAGDPGCVVDADGEKAIGPKYVCECGVSFGSWQERPKCPTCGKQMQGDKRALSYLHPDLRIQAYWILKTGERSSGWLSAKDCRKISEEREEEWVMYQESTEFRHDEVDVAELLAAVPAKKAAIVLPRCIILPKEDGQ